MLKERKIPHVQGCLVNEERILELEQGRPTDETIALADTFSKDLAQTDAVVNHHGKSIGDLYKLVEKMDQRLEQFITYTKKLYKFMKKGPKK